MNDIKNPNHSEEQGNVRPMLQWIAVASLLCAVLRAFSPQQVDEKTAMFLVLAIVALVIDRITKFKGFGFEIEKEVKQLETAVTNLEKNLGPGRKSAAANLAPVMEENSRMEKNDEQPRDPGDPNKGKFGGSPQANGRKLSAIITPLAGPKSSYCTVQIKVESTDKTKPLKGKVKLYLHPTFGRWSSYDLDVDNGVAEDEIQSYGGFTIGAEADGGKTRLELDLTTVRGGTGAFYEE